MLEETMVGRHCYQHQFVEIQKLCELLIEMGADINAVADNSQSALLSASYYGQSDTVEKLIDCGASVDEKLQDGWTPLLVASQQGSTKTVERLISKGADVNFTGIDGWDCISDSLTNWS